MFSAGDKIVHPLHGAGVVRELTEKEFAGSTELYYALDFVMDSVQIFLPVRAEQTSGLRTLCSQKCAEEVVSALLSLPVETEHAWNKRYRDNMLHIRSGNLMEVAQAARNLWNRERTHGLSTGEKKMLQSARKILLSELSLALHCEPAQLEKRLLDARK